MPDKEDLTPTLLIDSPSIQLTNRLHSFSFENDEYTEHTSPLSLTHPHLSFCRLSKDECVITDIQSNSIKIVRNSINSFCNLFINDTEFRTDFISEDEVFTIDIVTAKDITYVLLNSFLFVFKNNFLIFDPVHFAKPVNRIMITDTDQLVLYGPSLIVLSSDLFVSEIFDSDTRNFLEICNDISALFEISETITAAHSTSDLLILCDACSISLYSLISGKKYFSNQLTKNAQRLIKCDDTSIWLIDTEAISLYEITMTLIGRSSFSGVLYADSINSTIQLTTKNGDFLLDKKLTVFHEKLRIDKAVSIQPFYDDEHFLLVDSSGFHCANLKGQVLIEGSFSSPIRSAKLLDNGSGIAFLTEKSFVIIPPTSLKVYLSLEVSREVIDFCLNEQGNKLCIFSQKEAKEYYIRGNGAVFAREIKTRDDIVASHYLNNKLYIFTTEAAYYNTAMSSPRILCNFSKVIKVDNFFYAVTRKQSLVVMNSSLDTVYSLPLLSSVVSMCFVKSSQELFYSDGATLHRLNLAAGLHNDQLIIEFPALFCSNSGSLLMIDTKGSLYQWRS